MENMNNLNRPQQRLTAFKIRIGDLLMGKQVMDGEKFGFLELGNKQIIRVNVVANVVEKYENEGEKKFMNIVLDDASGQIRLKAFGEDVDKYREIGQGHTVMSIGMLRVYNGELYILPEIIRILDPRYLLVRKLELEKDLPKEIPKEERKAIKDQIIDLIKQSETNGGLEVEHLIMQLKAAPDIINQEVQKLLEEGLAYEPRPGKIRYLG